jgi:RHS repeat-associated protein
MLASSHQVFRQAGDSRRSRRGRFGGRRTRTKYLYNAVGERISKINSTTVLSVYDEAGHLIGEYDATGALIQETVWLGSIPVATLRPQSGGGVIAYYVHADQLGTPRMVSRASDNAVMWRWDSDPFGAAAANQNPQGNGTFVYNLRFPGQYYDAETGTHYNYQRDAYDPRTGRYLQSDPLGLAGQSYSAYAYVGDNPVSFIDPLGLVLCAATLPGLGNTYLDNNFSPMVNQFISLASAQGINLTFTSAFRTSAAQANPGAGWTTPAAPGNSLHEAGYAVDINYGSS